MIDAMFKQKQQMVAVIADDRAYLEMMREVLYDDGYSRVVCAPSENAFTTIARARPQVVLMDVYAKRWGDLRALLVDLRADPRTAGIPLIACTTDTQDVADAMGWLAGQGCDVLEKPFMFEYLQEKIQRVIDASDDGDEPHKTGACA